jgi:hypothetical protein
MNMSDVGRAYKTDLCVCVCVLLLPFARGYHSPVPRGGGQRCRTAARSTRPHALQAPSAAHHALPVSDQSSVVYVPLCRCVSCALSAKIPALPIEPRTLDGLVRLTGALLHLVTSSPLLISHSDPIWKDV